MRAIAFAAACTLAIAVAGGAYAEEPKAATAGGSGQNQAAPSTQAKPSAVAAPSEAETAAGPGQNQAAPSEEAKAPAAVEPAAGAAGQGAAGTGCPAGQVLGASGSCAPGRSN
jgi:hypothetical protein